jgi:hypothetical protein
VIDQLCSQIFNSSIEKLNNNESNATFIMKYLPSFFIIAFFLFLFSYSFDSEAQQTTAPILRTPTDDIKGILLKVTPLIDLEYQGESIVVLMAQEDTLLLSNGTMTPFWNAIDIVKHYGYSLNDVTTSGMGSQGNPTRFYAIMSKP